MNVLEKFKISPSTLGLLVFLKLNTGDEFIRSIVKQYLYDFETESGRKPLEILDEAGYIKYTKTGAKSRPWERVRLSEKGEQILKEMHKSIKHIAIFAKQIDKYEREDLKFKMLEILKNQKEMIKLIDKKLDLDVWQEVNHRKKCE